jgi:hypothetical protein
LGPCDVLEEHPRHPRSWSRSRHAPLHGIGVSDLAPGAAKGGARCRFLVAPLGPSVPLASRPGRLRRAGGRNSRGAGRYAAFRRRTRWMPGLPRTRPCRLRRTVAASPSDALPPGAAEPGRVPRRHPRPRFRRTAASGLGRATRPTASRSELVATHPRGRLRGTEFELGHCLAARRPLDRGLATQSGSKTKPRHVPSHAPKPIARIRETRSRHPKMPLAGPNRRPEARTPRRSDPPARLRPRPAFGATRAPKSTLGTGPPASPRRNIGLLRYRDASEETLRTRDRPFRPKRTRRPASEAAKPEGDPASDRSNQSALTSVRPPKGPRITRCPRRSDANACTISVPH